MGQHMTILVRQLSGWEEKVADPRPWAARILDLLLSGAVGPQLSHYPFLLYRCQTRREWIFMASEGFVVLVPKKKGN